MAFNDNEWGKIGKIPADSDFFAGGFEYNDIVGTDGFTPGFSKLLGEQVFKLTEPSEHPFTAKFVGAPIRAGAGWVERLMKRLGAGTQTPGNAKAGVIKRGDGYATGIKGITADDDLRYYDMEGKEFVYPSDNYRGWIPMSLPSNLDTFDEFIEANGIGQLNGMLVDNVKQAYDNALETAIQKKVINSIPSYEAVGNIGGKELFTKIRDYVSRMRSDDYAYNQYAIPNGTFTTAEPSFNTDYEHKAKDVTVFMDRITYNHMMDDFSSLYSPDYIKEIGAEIVLTDNRLVTPYATTQAMLDDGFTAYAGLDITADFPMVGKPSPEVVIVDKRFAEYRPIIDSYRINVSRNGAGDFTNEHMHFVGGLIVRPWASAVALGNVSIQ